MIQIIEQSYEDKVKMYMKCSKKELVTMLISCNDIINNLIPINSYTAYNILNNDTPYSPTAKWITTQ